MSQSAAAVPAAAMSTIEPLAAAVQRVSLARGVVLSVAWCSVLQALQGGAVVAFAEGRHASSASAWQVIDVDTALVDLAARRITLDGCERFALPGTADHLSRTTWRDLVGRDAVIAWLRVEVGEGIKPADYTGSLSRYIGLQRTVVDELVAPAQAANQAKGGSVLTMVPPQAAQQPQPADSRIVHPAAGSWPHKEGERWTDGEREAMFQMRHLGGMSDQEIADVVGTAMRQNVPNQIGTHMAWKSEEGPGWPPRNKWRPQERLLTACHLVRAHGPFHSLGMVAAKT